MTKMIQNLIKEVIRVKLSGKNMINGTLIDVGNDIIVLFNGDDFMYIPLKHVQSLAVDDENEDDIEIPTEFPNFIADENKTKLSLSEVVTQAKGSFVEIYVTGDLPLYGRITSVKNDYIVFQSPVYKTMYISLEHLKWLISHAKIKKPFDLENDQIPVQPNAELLANTFAAQVEKFINKLVVFNISGNKSYLGRIINFEKQVVEIQTVKSSPIYLNLKHIKTIHLV